MKLSIDRLAEQLSRAALAPVYLLFGDEPLQLLEAADGIRERARAEGIEERIVLTVDSAFDWSRLAQLAENLSLFASRRLLELRLGGNKPGREGGSAVTQYLERAGDADVLLVTADKLDRSAQQTRWFKALERKGVVAQSWPVDAARLPAWIQRRLGARGVAIGADALGLLAERVEGNLLAAKQEMDRLCLVVEERAIDVEDVLGSVGDSARFDLFTLGDCAMAGDAGRCLKVLDGLRAEGTEPVMLSWLMTRELRQLSLMAHDVAQGTPAARVMEQHRVWQRRQGAVQAALARHSAEDCLAMLGAARVLDRVVKGAPPGDPWEGLRALTVALARGLRPRGPRALAPWSDAEMDLLYVG